MPNPLAVPRVNRIRYELAPGTPFVNLVLESGKTINVIPHYLESLEDRVFATGSPRLTKFTFYDRSWDTLENLLIPSRHRIRWAYGWVGGDWTGVIPGIINVYKPSFSMEGARLEITAMEVVEKRTPGIWTRFFDDGRPSSVSHAPQNAKQIKPSRISDIVRHIATEMGVPADIEETDGKSVWGQHNETNMAFIERLSLFAKSKTGRVDFEARLNGGRLYFGTPDYAPYRTFYFFRDQSGPVLSYEAVINQNQIFGGKWDRLRVASWDPTEKKAIGHEVNLTTGSGTGGRVPLAKEAFDPPGLKRATAGRLYVAPYEDASLAETYNRRKFEESARKIAQCRITLIGDPTFRVGDTFTVIVITDRGDVHYTSGEWKSDVVTHKITPGNFVTEITAHSDGHRLAGIENIGRLVKRDFQPRPTKSGETIKEAKMDEKAILKQLTSGFKDSFKGIGGS
mgnify:CR=1 FL=1